MPTICNLFGSLVYRNPRSVSMPIPLTPNCSKTHPLKQVRHLNQILKYYYKRYVLHHTDRLTRLVQDKTIFVIKFLTKLLCYRI
jgi:hypothetical protein